MSDIILEAKNLTKEFKGFVAVNNVNLKVKRGNIHVLIDPKSNNLNIDIQAAYLTDSFRKNCRTFAGDFCRCRRWPMAACLS